MSKVSNESTFVGALHQVSVQGDEFDLNLTTQTLDERMVNQAHFTIGLTFLCTLNCIPLPSIRFC